MWDSRSKSTTNAVCQCCVYKWWAVAMGQQQCILAPGAWLVIVSVRMPLLSIKDLAAAIFDHSGAC